MLHSRIFTFNPLGTNCVVLWEDGQKACTVVDPGMSSADGAQDLFDFFEKQGLTPDAILLTHGHFDHFWGVEKLLARYTAWKVIHTPGHTPGGVCYYSAENNLLLSGDTLFAGSIGRTDLHGGDYDKLMASIQDKLLTLPGETDVIPGHGHPTSIAQEGMHNPFLQPFNEPGGDFPEEGISIEGI